MSYHCSYFTDQLVLVGGDCSEDSLREHPCLVPQPGDVGDGARGGDGGPRVQQHQVDPGLELVHRVQHNLTILKHYS